MEDFAAMLIAAKDLMGFSLTLYGFTCRFWDIFIWSIIAGIVIYVIVRLFE